jgi:hypothetical protein
MSSCDQSSGARTGVGEQAQGQTQYTDAELLEIYDFAVKLARDAGRILNEGVEKKCGGVEGRDQEMVDKESSVDILTQTDLGMLPLYRC